MNYHAKMFRHSAHHDCSNDKTSQLCADGHCNGCDGTIHRTKATTRAFDAPCLCRCHGVRNTPQATLDKKFVDESLAESHKEKKGSMDWRTHR